MKRTIVAHFLWNLFIFSVHITHKIMNNFLNSHNLSYCFHVWLSQSFPSQFSCLCKFVGIQFEDPVCYVWDLWIHFWSMASNHVAWILSLIVVRCCCMNPCHFLLLCKMFSRFPDLVVCGGCGARFSFWSGLMLINPSFAQIRVWYFSYGSSDLLAWGFLCGHIFSSPIFSLWVAPLFWWSSMLSPFDFPL